VTLTGGSVISGLAFGIRDAAIYDFGDLPAKYHASTLSENGARHLRGPYFLGTAIDGEFDGVPSGNANGDDLVGTPDDEDGVEEIPLSSGASATLTVTASRYNGYLQAWFDWNDDGDFNDANERVITDRLLDEGENSITIAVPSGVTANQVYARFRYGEFGINSVFGAALTGEVEDHVFTVIPQAPALAGMASDFNQDGTVDGFDFLAWQRNLGKPTGAAQAQGSADADGDVDRLDLIKWSQHFGESLTAVASATSSAALAAEQSAGASQSVTDEFTRGGSAPLAVLSGGVSSPTMRPAFRPKAEPFSSSSANAASVLDDNVAVTASDRDAALDDLFDSPDLLESGADEDVSVADGDEAFALLGSSL
jgi:hypothetical protein